MSHLKPLTEQNFVAEVVRSPLPVLIDFAASWCGPCRMLAPTLERLAQEFQGRVKFVQVDIDTQSGLADQFGIDSVPTLILFVQGSPVGRVSGLVPEASLRTALQQYGAAAA